MMFPRGRRHGHGGAGVARAAGGARVDRDVIGGGGHLCGEMARGFVRAGCKVALLDLRIEKNTMIMLCTFWGFEW